MADQDKTPADTADAGLTPVPRTELMKIAHEYEQAKRLDDAGRLLRHILNADATYAPALHLMGVVAYRRGDKARALTLMEKALQYGIDTPLYYRNIGELYRVMGRHTEAAAAARKSIALNPGDATALMNCAIVLADQKLTDEAIEYFEQALSIRPDLPAAHFGLAEALLSQGKFTRGWEEYEWRFRLADVPPLMPPTKKPQWDGAPMPGGTLVLIADQGFGDGVQFGRYIPWAAARAGKIILACSPQLKPILRQLDPDMRLSITWSDVGDFDAWCPLTGLPRLAGMTLENIPRDIPYLTAEPKRALHWKAQLDGLTPRGLRRVGIVWAGRPAHKNDWKRSMTLADLAPITARDDIALIVLQKGPQQQQTGGYYGRAPLIHLSAEVEGFDDTMAIMAGLDLVLTVDTSVAHLAGAMGVPVWIMLPWCAEWRWLQERTDSPWYPTARLFRQPTPNNWQGVAEQVAAALDLRG